MEDGEIPFDDVIIEYKIKGKKDKYDEILEDVIFQKRMYEISKELKITLDEANIEAKKNLKSMFASHDQMASNFFIKSFDLVINSGFEKKIDINYEEIQKLTTLMSKNSVAFVSSHKSYLDLIIFFIILKKYDFPLPYIFSGINLDMPIVGDIVRKSGIIFIKRNIKDDFIYKEVLKHYISWLLKKKAHFVWSIEGGRSRTGKVANPKLGILKYIFNQNIKIVPVSIIYDSIPDLDELILEAQGKRKKLENLDWMINYLKKVCSENRGKISLRFGLGDDLNDLNLNKGDLISFANNIVNNINDITPITISSLICSVLFSKGSLNEKELWYYISLLVKNNSLFLDKNIRLAKSIQKGIRLLTQDDIIRKQGDKYIINHNKYYHAVYYINMSISHFYKKAFLEISFLSSKPTEELNFLKDIFYYEFPDFSEFSDFSNEEMNGKEQNSKEGEIHFSPFVLSNCLGTYKLLFEAVIKYEEKNEGKDEGKNEEEKDEGKNEEEKDEGKNEEKNTKENSENPPEKNTEKDEEEDFLNYCMFLNEENHWLGRGNFECYLPFLQNGRQIIKKLNINKDNANKYLHKLKKIEKRVNKLKTLHVKISKEIKEIEEIEDYINPLTENILKGEKGAHIGVFFDLDKTLIQGMSAWSFAKKRLMSGKTTSHEIVTQFLGLAQYIYDRENFENMVKTATSGLIGLKEKEFLDIGDESYMKDISIYEETYELISAHKKMSHTICIISAASNYQVYPIAKYLDISIVECTELETENGKFTGEIKKLCWGKGKKDAGLRLAEKYGLDLKKTYFYTDSIEDIELLEIVGNPRPVNPDLNLLNHSFNKGWDIKNFGDQENTENMIRTFMSYFNLIPAVIKGFAEGGKYKALESMGDIATSVGGIIVKIKNEEIVWQNRPAVFIFNHQSHVDMIVVIKLIKRDAVGIARKEIKNYPIIGQILDAAGTVFIDTENRNSAIDSLKPAVDGLKKGISLAIFPEGTRSFNYTLGPFKKGAFHIAMQAEVPIVPIVIKNSHDIMPRGSHTIVPGIIDVTVLDPISTKDWSLSNLDEKITMVRNLYLNELGQ